MAFIAGHWLLWLVLMIVFGGYALYNQLKRMKGMMKKGLSLDVDGAFGSFFSGTGYFVVAGVLGSGSGMLLLISVIINLVAYLRT